MVVGNPEVDQRMRVGVGGKDVPEELTCRPQYHFVSVRPHIVLIDQSHISTVATLQQRAKRLLCEHGMTFSPERDKLFHDVRLQSKMSLSIDITMFVKAKSYC